MQMLGSAKGWLFPVSVTYKSGKSQTPGQLSRHFMSHEAPLGLLTTPRQLLPDPLVPPVSYPLPGEKEGFGQASKWWIVPSPAPTEALLQGLLWTEVRNAPRILVSFTQGSPRESITPPLIQPAYRGIVHTMISVELTSLCVYTF